ncbi:hypothetical protein CTAYLR_008663 [Chrysophaeum taylorii]|uniref:Uncharacterized protein n=1 Tax=Chrysophaeum taylorii TaxID=2483200 RepID=A0AAD7U643_9STRA|nr:hypothetical protein CTAYLR_008663 [Chrysophaeum taylorii]
MAMTASRPLGATVNTDITKAAGVDWGEEGMTERMKEMQRKHDELIYLGPELTINHVKEFHDWVAQLTREIAQEGEDLKRRFRMAMAKRNRTKDAKRAAAYDKCANTIYKLQDRYNKEVAMTQFEVEWLQNSPAFKQMLEYREKYWVKTAKGDYVCKRDLAEDAAVSFDDLLSEFKEEAHPPATASRDDSP